MRLKPLTWDELAELYRKRTGGNARIKSMEEIADWALTQKDVKANKAGDICRRVR